MNLWKATGTIGGLTMVSRVLGFAREMLMARVMGASAAADAFFVAFRLPNTFRRLFGEGAFSAGFVPLFSQRLHGEEGRKAPALFRGSAGGVPADPDPVHARLRDHHAALRRGDLGL